MGKLKKLAGDTIIYGVSTIFGRLLNWLLMPFYIRTLDADQFGGVVNIYSYIAVVLVFLTFGFETAYFRYVKPDNRAKLLKTLGATLSVGSLVFCGLVYVFQIPIANLLGNEHLVSDFFVLAALIVSRDAVTSIPFADLRFRNKTVRYAGLKFVSVLLNIFFNVFFLVVCPYLLRQGYSFVNSFFNEDNRLIYVFVSNLIGSGIISVFLVPSVFKSNAKFDWSLLKVLLRYSYPIMLVGLFGMVIQNIDKILMPHLIDNEAMKALAVYGANYKIGILMALFIQSYRLAFEPFFFKEGKNNASKELYARILKFFVVFGLIIYVGVLLFIDLINVLLIPEYYEGNVIIPFILLGQLFFGIYYSLSLWYKLSDRTNFGAVIGGIGAIIAVAGNIILVPHVGYIGAAISSFVCFLLMTVLSYGLGQKYYPVNYSVLRILAHITFAVLLVWISGMLSIHNELFNLTVKGAIFASYIAFLYFAERKDLIKTLS